MSWYLANCTSWHVRPPRTEISLHIFVQSDQSLMASLWVAKGSTLLQTEKLRPFRMC